MLGFFDETVGGRNGWGPCQLHPGTRVICLGCFLPDLHSHRFWVESEKRFVTLRVSAKGMRVIDKKGIDTVLAELRARGEKY